MHRSTKLSLLTFALLAGCPSSPAATPDSGTPGTDTGTPTTDTGTPTTDTGTPTTDAPPAAPTCDDYCTTIMANCTTENAQYTSMANCLANCEAFPVGTAGETAGNTLGCRSYHAGAAEGGPDVHCVHAGPSGGGVCGAGCDAYCELVLANCTDANEVYADADACALACEGLADDVDYSTAASSGNSLACRIYHANAAGEDPDVHCSHTAAASAVCN